MKVIEKKSIKEKLKVAPYELPEGWRWVRLENTLLGNPQYGYTASATDNRTDTKFLRITDIQNGNVKWEEVPYCSANSKVENYVLAKDDMVFARTGATTGKTFLIKDELKEKIIFASYLIRIRPNKTIVLPDFLNEYFKSHFYWMQIQPKGGANPNFNAQKLKKILIPIPFKNNHPDLETQKQIVEKIDTIFKKIDQAEKLRQTALEKTKTAFDVVLNKIFKEAKEGKGWKCVRLEEIANIIMGQSPPSSTYNTEGIGLPFYQGKLEFGEIYPKGVNVWCNSPKKISLQNDLLISVRAPVGDINIAKDKYAIGRGLSIVRPNTKKVLLFYLFHYLNCFKSSWEGKGATFKAINKVDLENLKIPIPYNKNNHPNLEKQKQIVNYLDKLQGKIKQLDGLQTIQLQKFTALRESILNKAFRGEL